jgi:hypothetical protein
MERHKEEILSGDRTGAVLGRFVPDHKEAGTFDWINVIAGQRGTRPIKDSKRQIVQFPNIDPLPGKTEFGRADKLPYYWDYEDTNQRRRGVQGLTAKQADLRIPGEEPDGIPEFVDGPEDVRNAEIDFVTFLVTRPSNANEKHLDVLGGFRWTFHEGGKRRGFNNGDEWISSLAPVSLGEDTAKLLGEALRNSGFNNWSITMKEGEE